MTADVDVEAIASSDPAMPMEKENMENVNISDNSSDDNKVESASISKKAPPVFTPELLKMYYSKLFPFSMLHSWLGYDPLGKHPQLFSRREFSFTIEPTPGDEIYCRYESFSTDQDLKQAVMKRRPHKIDIGAIFSHQPKDHNAVTNFTPVQRELVFDIDLTDYDEVRQCGCTGAVICLKCWTFMTMAVKVMDQGLREDFGFEHIAWFYSGRRGVHAWVCDESARLLSNEARSAVATYFEVSMGNDRSRSSGLPHPLHPMLSRAYAILEPMFVEHVIPESGHGLLATEESWEKFLQSIPAAAEPVREKLTEVWSNPRNVSTPAEKWQTLKKHLTIFIGKHEGTSSKKINKHLSSSDRNKIENWPVETVFKYTYPRLDINVSKMQNHLLKSPFCVHPKTGRVCVPIQVESVDSFDPFDVPTLPVLMNELDEYAASTDMETGSNLQDWEKTSLKAYFKPFQKDFLEPLLKSLRRKERELAEERAAITGDF